MSFQRHRYAVNRPARVALDDVAVVMVFFGTGAFVTQARDIYPHYSETTRCAHDITAVAGAITQSNDSPHFFLRIIVQWHCTGKKVEYAIGKLVSGERNKLISRFANDVAVAGVLDDIVDDGHPSGNAVLSKYVAA
jgi:hypothetical protein